MIFCVLSLDSEMRGGRTQRRTVAIAPPAFTPDEIRKMVERDVISLLKEEHKEVFNSRDSDTQGFVQGWEDRFQEDLDSLRDDELTWANQPHLVERFQLGFEQEWERVLDYWDSLQQEGGGARKTVVHHGHTYKVRAGPRGGKYILVAKKKVYV